MAYTIVKFYIYNCHIFQEKLNKITLWQQVLKAREREFLVRNHRSEIEKYNNK